MASTPAPGSREPRPFDDSADGEMEAGRAEAGELGEARAEAGRAGEGQLEAGEGDQPADPFEALVWKAFDALPDAFRERLGSVAIVIEDEPTPEQLESVNAHGLLGLYTGLPRTTYAAENYATTSKIVIFRGPHLRIFRDPDSLERGVAETVRHEIAHHFGISDARLEELARERQKRE
jgi:predicted Zn-dependent protease with MMP-like domain